MGECVNATYEIVNLSYLNRRKRGLPQIRCCICCAKNGAFGRRAPFVPCRCVKWRLSSPSGRPPAKVTAASLIISSYVFLSRLFFLFLWSLNFLFSFYLSRPLTSSLCHASLLYLFLSLELLCVRLL